MNIKKFYFNIATGQKMRNAALPHVIDRRLRIHASVLFHSSPTENALTYLLCLSLRPSSRNAMVIFPLHLHAFVNSVSLVMILPGR